MPGRLCDPHLGVKGTKESRQMEAVRRSVAGTHAEAWLAVRGAPGANFLRPLARAAS